MKNIFKLFLLYKLLEWLSKEIQSFKVANCSHVSVHMQVHTHTHTTTTIIQVIRPTSSHPNIAIRTTTPMKSVTMINGVRNPHTGHKPFRRLKQNRFIRKLPESKNIYLSVTLKCAQEFVLVTFHSLQCVNKWTQ